MYDHTPVPKKIFVDPSELSYEIIASRERGKLTPRAIELLMQMTEHISSVFQYKNPDDRKDCCQSAMLDVLVNWKSFNPERENANCFSYFTQIIKCGMAKGWKRINGRLRSVQRISISDERGMYNI